MDHAPAFLLTTHSPGSITRLQTEAYGVYALDITSTTTPSGYRFSNVQDKVKITDQPDRAVGRSQRRAAADRLHPLHLPAQSCQGQA
eukprot:2167689-Prymnesium_polylepis.1